MARLKELIEDVLKIRSREGRSTNRTEDPIKPILSVVDNGSQDGEAIRFDLFWDTFISIAKQPPDYPNAINSLSEIVKDIKSRGTLIIRGTPAKTPLGVAWTDLPYLGVEMREAWNNAPPTSTALEWQHINEFAARLTFDDTCNFSLYGIWMLRDALETPRLLTERQSNEGDRQPSDEDEVSVDELLPAALQWIFHCRDLLMKLSIEGHSYAKSGVNAPDPAFLGKLAKDAGVEQTGYNARRWNFWRSRLEEISKATDHAGGREKVAKVAYQGVQQMEKIDKK